MDISQRLSTAIQTIQTARIKLNQTNTIITGAKEGTSVNGGGVKSDPSSYNFNNNTNNSGRSLPYNNSLSNNSQNNHTPTPSMLECPPTLNDGEIPSGFKLYEGDPAVFHCGYDGIKENRTPTIEVPQNECFYDEHGNIVDETHEYAYCGGSPNQYDAGTNPIAHTFLDDGGIVGAGWDGFTESVDHKADSVVDSISETVDNVTESISETVDSVTESISDFFSGW